MVHSDPYITGQYNPLNALNNQIFFIAQMLMKVDHLSERDIKIRNLPGPDGAKGNDLINPLGVFAHHPLEATLGGIQIFQK